MRGESSTINISMLESLMNLVMDRVGEKAIESFLHMAHLAKKTKDVLTHQRTCRKCDDDPEDIKDTLKRQMFGKYTKE